MPWSSGVQKSPKPANVMHLAQMPTFGTFLVGFLRFYAEIIQNGTFRALFAGAADADDIGPL